jgi:flagellar biosynthesis/type III secretory pathway chaperone
MENPMISELISVIKNEEGLLQSFLDLLEEQKNLLVKNQISEFEESVRKQEEMIVEIKTLESERIRMVNEIARGMEIEESEITLTRLVEMSLGKVSEELGSAKRNMSHLVERIRRANQVNDYLIRRSLNVSQKSIDMLIDESLRDVIYESTGKISGQDRRSLIINKTL